MREEFGVPLAKKAGFDPHFHGKSTAANEKARLLLPNFSLAYDAMGCSDYHSLDSIDPSIAIEVQGSLGFSIQQKIFRIGRYDRNPESGHYGSCPGDENIDVLGLEMEYHSLKDLFARSVRNDRYVRVHMGETIIPEQGRDNIDSLLKEAGEYYDKASKFPLRIGHGTHASIEAMLEMATRGYYVEACLSSKKKTGVIAKRSDYPLALMLMLGVNVVIGTDGGPLYSTDLAQEFVHAQKSILKFYTKMGCSNDFISTPGGQPLLFKHIRHLVKGNCLEADAARVSFKALPKYLKPEVFTRISTDTLADNNRRLLAICQEKDRARSGPMF